MFSRDTALCLLPGSSEVHLATCLPPVLVKGPYQQTSSLCHQWDKAPQLQGDGSQALKENIPGQQQFLEASFTFSEIDICIQRTKERCSNSRFLFFSSRKWPKEREGGKRLPCQQRGEFSLFMDIAPSLTYPHTVPFTEFLVVIQSPSHV